MAANLGPPPSSISGDLKDYLVKIQRLLNQIPQVSFFSGTTPNSVLSGSCGALAVNVGSASTSSRLWMNTADPSSALTTTGWVIVRIAE